jgi:hypothetical protein
MAITDASFQIGVKYLEMDYNVTSGLYVNECI